MGLTDLFSTTANLRGILDTEDQLAVSKMIHKAIIDVNESGTEAAGRLCTEKISVLFNFCWGDILHLIFAI